MASQLMSRRLKHFADNHLAWCSLAHFLSAGMTRELCEAVVYRASGGSLTLGNLFEYTAHDGKPPTDPWIALPLERKDELDHFLQRVVRTLIWASDGFIGVAPGAPPAITELEAAMVLGHVDFGTIGASLKSGVLPGGSSADRLYKAVERLRSSDSDDAMLSVKTSLRAIAMPLRAVMLKHLGDLLADVDKWQPARAMYAEALRQFEAHRSKAWAELSRTLIGVCRQSHATATRTISGPEDSARELALHLDPAGLADAPQFYANASYDAMVAAMLSPAKFFAPDQRAHALVAPQLLSVLDIGPALVQSSKKDHGQAQRYFWSVLRRQIALGSAQESRETKGQFARAILEEITDSAAKHFRPESFATAARLLLESGDVSAVETAAWSDALVARYVVDETIRNVVVHAQTHSGARFERTQVLVAMFAQILEHVRADRESVVAAIADHLGRLSLEPDTPAFGIQGLATSALKAFKAIGRKRPELHAQLAAAVVNPLIRQITLATDMQQVGEAMETAKIFLGSWDEPAMDAIVAAVLARLSSLDADTGAWPIVRGAMDILTSLEVTQLVQREGPSAQNIVRTVVRFGLGKAGEQVTLLEYLSRLSDDLIQGVISQQQLDQLVDDVRKVARQINSSGSPGCIAALLAASRLAKTDGVTDAVRATIEILESVGNGRTSISFAYAYHGLIIIAQRKGDIQRDTKAAPDEFQNLLLDLVPPLVGAWHRAAQDPALMNGFALPPPTAPNTVIVHNWTFASIGFARAVGQEQVVSDAVSEAARNPLLTEAIAIARAVRLSAGDEERFDEQQISRESAEAFYAALGQRLVQLQRMPTDARRRVLGPIVSQCLRHGPNGLDVGAFLLVLEAGASKDAPDSQLVAYQRRLDQQDRELRFAISPLIHELRRRMPA